MGVMEQHALGMAAVLLKAYEIGDLINHSQEIGQYLDARRNMQDSEEVQALIRALDQKKRLYEECQRFGHFHPDYHAALEEARKAQKALDSHALVREFKQAEESLDDLLYSVSKMIAHSVSESIKVPSNQLLPSSGGCGSGGSCSGNCG
ncbi:YlbF family regulator [Ferviditalea candida]|uniref:YlbF family regulator n=1 Tax=Ferviditalea candida TaxID=3108399 RepID=A0ABU5ZFH2_9BACL|nr:YlbF family regulator [Paenibacillaceae bacterium T2]